MGSSCRLIWSSPALVSQASSVHLQEQEESIFIYFILFISICIYFYPSKSILSQNLLYISFKTISIYPNLYIQIFFNLAESISIYMNLYLSILIYCYLSESIPINLIYLSESVSMNLNLFLSVFIYDYPSDYISIYLLNFYLSDSISIFLIYVYLSISIYLN